MTTREKILLVEDDASILNGLQLNLEMEGYEVRAAHSAEQALTLLGRELPQMVILDIMLPGMDGYALLRRIRSLSEDIPVLMLTARDGPGDKVQGLDLGADDYITKPFALPEFLARINANLRRQRKRKSASGQLIGIGQITINRAARSVLRGDVPIAMTTREFDLLFYLIQARGRVLTRAQILENIWGPDYEGTERTVDNFVVRIRTKIELDPENPRHIQTVRGVGYRFVLDDEL